MKNTISEMGNTPEGIKCRLDDTKECIRTLKYRVLKITEAKQQKGQKMKIMESGPIT